MELTCQHWSVLNIQSLYAPVSQALHSRLLKMCSCPEIIRTSVSLAAVSGTTSHEATGAYLPARMLGEVIDLQVNSILRLLLLHRLGHLRHVAPRQELLDHLAGPQQAQGPLGTTWHSSLCTQHESPPFVAD